MRRLKRDKLKPSSYAEAAAAAADPMLDLGNVDAAKAIIGSATITTTTSASKATVKSRSPPQQRRRSVLLGLGGSVRELVEQVQDSLSKSKQETTTAVSTTSGTDLASIEKPSRSSSTKPSRSSSSSNPSSTHSTPASPSSATVTSGGGGGVAVMVSPAPKKKVLDIKLLPSGTSLTLRMKKPAQLTPSPSEFKSRQRPDAADKPFCGVCATPFTIMVRRQRCQVCGESVCAQCSTDKRYVEGQKGLQRVCDICIVEGPVVLDENGMYAVGPSPAATPIPAPSAPAPPIVASVVTVKAPTRPPAPPPPLAAVAKATGAVTATGPTRAPQGNLRSHRHDDDEQQHRQQIKQVEQQDPSSASVAAAAVAAASVTRTHSPPTPRTSSSTGSCPSGIATQVTPATTTRAHRQNSSNSNTSNKNNAVMRLFADAARAPVADKMQQQQQAYPSVKATSSAGHGRGGSGDGAWSMAGGGRANGRGGVGQTSRDGRGSSFGGDVAVVKALAPQTAGEGAESRKAVATAVESAASVARELVEEKEAEAAGAAAAAALGGDEDDDDQDGPPPAVVAPTRQRRRSKKARRASAEAAEASKAATALERKFSRWSNQSFFDFLGIGTGYANADAVAADGGSCTTPHSVGIPSRSTPTDLRDRGFFSHGSSASAAAAGHSAGAGAATTGGGGGPSGGSNSNTRKWESMIKRRSSGGSGGGGGGGAGARGESESCQAVGSDTSAFVRDFIRGAGIHRLDPRRLAGSLLTCASWTGLDRMVTMAWALVHKLLEGRGRHHTQAHTSGRSGRHGGGGVKGKGAGGNGVGREGARRWRPGRRVMALSAVVLLASYRRYQVTHPEVTAEHVLGSAGAVVFALAYFLTRAVADLARDACGIILPSVCGSRTQRLLTFAQGHGSGGGMEAVEEGEESGWAGGAGVGGEGRGAASASASAAESGGQDGAAAGVGEGHELDRFFFL